ncbi:hypothetical protein BD410DRAFT_787323 [Rickenella mellea]|uniref:Secreted protein n=1 Tax=Rickenella mellea TaxID=50990 RepID=A0A4Y7Q8F7_9AGAM|nr:hypothetical protein BD410DRAFT_787323 [Rickenella mellea]
MLAIFEMVFLRALAVLTVVGAAASEPPKLHARRTVDLVAARAPSPIQAVSATLTLGVAAATPHAVSTSTAPQTTYSLIPASASPDGYVNVTVNATDPRIQYSGLSGLQWTNSSTCSTKSKSCKTFGSFLTFQFTGTAIFFNVGMGPTGMICNATMDGMVSFLIDGYRPNPGCGPIWSQFGMANILHTVNISLIGPSALAPPSEQSQAAVDFLGFTVTTASGNSSGTLSNGTNSTTPSSASYHVKPTESLPFILTLIFIYFGIQLVL